MSNIHYAVVIIGALSLLLGLGLGQIYYQHQRIEQLEFNRFRQSGHLTQKHYCQNDFCRAHQLRDSREAVNRARAKVQAQGKIDLEEAVRHYNKRLKRWEGEWRRSGLYRVVE